MKDKFMYFREMDGDARRILIDATQFYEAFLEVVREAERYRGGLRWKKTGDKDYLFRTWGRRGYGRSLGPRSAETERLYAQFHQKKSTLEERKKALFEQIKRQARFCIAAGVNRVPKISANVVRALDEAGLMGHGLTVLGTHAIFAYEAACGVVVQPEIMATADIDLLFDANAKLRLTGAIETGGLIGLLRKVDKSFEIPAEGHFRALNRTGFMVELVKSIPKPPQKVERQRLGSAPDDLVAAEMKGFAWLQNAPTFTRIAIAEDGLPVRLHVPDPRFFALNKLWVSEEPDRDPRKRVRDRMQAELVIQLAEDYLGLSFEDEALRVFPQDVRDMLHDVDRASPEPSSPFHGM